MGIEVGFSSKFEGFWSIPHGFFFRGGWQILQDMVVNCFLNVLVMIPLSRGFYKITSQFWSCDLMLQVATDLRDLERYGMFMYFTTFGTSSGHQNRSSIEVRSSSELEQRLEMGDWEYLRVSEYKILQDSLVLCWLWPYSTVSSQQLRGLVSAMLH